jgi:hypothetical protein
MLSHQLSLSSRLRLGLLLVMGVVEDFGILEFWWGEFCPSTRLSSAVVTLSKPSTKFIAMSSHHLPNNYFHSRYLLPPTGTDEIYITFPNQTTWKLVETLSETVQMGRYEQDRIEELGYEPSEARIVFVSEQTVGPRIGEKAVIKVRIQ